jgi:rod shape-determining protein MreD
VRAAVVLLLALTVQAAVVAELPVAGVRANVVLLVPIVAALLEGPDRGAVAGFVAGVAVDLLVQTPFGLSALAYCLAGYAVGAAQAGVLRASWWLPVVAAVGGSAIGIVAFALVGAVIGVEDVLNLELVRVVAVVGALNALLVAPALRLARWVEGPADRARMAIR